MKYILILIVIIIVIVPSIYLFSYAKYEWKGNKTSSIGSIVLAAVSIVFPAVVIILR